MCSYIQCPVYKCFFPNLIYLSIPAPPHPPCCCASLCLSLALILFLAAPSTPPRPFLPFDILNLSSCCSLLDLDLFPPPPFPHFLVCSRPLLLKDTFLISNLLQLLRLLVLHRSLAVLLFLSLLLISLAVLPLSRRAAHLLAVLPSI